MLKTLKKKLKERTNAAANIQWHIGIHFKIQSTQKQSNKQTFSLPIEPRWIRVQPIHRQNVEKESEKE